MDTSFRDRFNAWKQGKTVYKNGLRISFDEGKDADPEQTVEQPDLSAALDYVRGVKRDVLLNFDEGKDVAGGHHFNAIKLISPNAGLSYGSYYDKLTGDWMIDARRLGLPRFGGGKNSFRPTARQLRTISVIVQELLKAGFTDYDIAGILANGKIESSFDPAAVNKSDHRGVWQNETARHRGVRKVYGDHSLGSQIKYLIDWEAGGGKPTELLDSTLSTHGNVIFKKGTYKSARDAAIAFERAYERSGGQLMKERLDQVDAIYDWLRATSPGSIVVNNSNTDESLINSRRIVPPTQRVVTTTPPPAAPTNAGLWDNLAIPRPLVPYDDGKDVDTRSDTTRRGYHEGDVPWGSGNDAAGLGPLYLMDAIGRIGSSNTGNYLIGMPPAVGRWISGSTVGNLFGSGTKSIGKAPRLMTPEILQNTYNVKSAIRNSGIKQAKTKLDKYGRDWVELNKDKVDLSQLTAEDVNKLIRMSRQDLLSHGDDYVMVDEHPFTGDYTFNVMRNGRSVAELDGRLANGMVAPDMVSSFTDSPGMSRMLYDAAIEAGPQLGYNGVRSGDHLISAPKTWSVWKHYPDKRLINNKGYHLNRMMTVSPTKDGRSVKSMKEAEKAAAENRNFTFEEGPVYQLPTASLFVPVKSIVPDASIVRANGTFARSWNTTDIHRAALPFAIGGGLWAAEGEHNRGKDVPRYRGGKDYGINIKPSHRGRFTKLKLRTGHSTSWFKEHGTPAQKKMATFAQNARKWKH